MPLSISIQALYDYKQKEAQKEQDKANFNSSIVRL